eukprot:7201415-Prymnesium_polylepis.1
MTVTLFFHSCAAAAKVRPPRALVLCVSCAGCVAPVRVPRRVRCLGPSSGTSWCSWHRHWPGLCVQFMACNGEGSLPTSVRASPIDSGVAGGGTTRAGAAAGARVRPCGSGVPAAAPLGCIVPWSPAASSS